MFVIMHRIILTITVLFIFSLAFACSGVQNAAGGGSSPTDAYKKLFAAVKSKDTEAIKKQLTKKSIDLGVTSAARSGKTVEQVYENGFTATTFADALPNIRDERVKDDMGAIEVWNSKESKWEDLPFMKEDGGWKLAVGDVFARTYLPPGPGRDYLEKQAANVVSNNAVTLASNSNSNTVMVANSVPGPPTVNKKTK